MTPVAKDGNALRRKIQIDFRYQSITMAKLKVLPKVIQRRKGRTVTHDEHLALRKQLLFRQGLYQE